MATVIFVHGTGGRWSGYNESLKKIETKLTKALVGEREPVVFTGCPWGELHGSLPASLSIPDYRKTGGRQTGITAPPDENEVLLWEMLGYDPLYELRGLALQPATTPYPTGAGPFRARVLELAARVTRGLQVAETAPADTLVDQLRAAGIANEFPAACSELLQQDEFTKALERSSSPGQCRFAVARALIAVATDSAPRSDLPVRVRSDRALRDALVVAVADALPIDRFPPWDWTKNLLFGAAKRWGTWKIGRGRGEMTDQASAAVADILLYQSKGRAIRRAIAESIHKAKPPVALIAHSLGGIACVDLLAMVSLPQVELLVTVGSQAPFLYETNALHSLDYGEPLPATFVRRWVNIYDPRDALGYKGEGVFTTAPGGPPRVADRVVNNGLPFPDAHSGYWDNDETWQIIAPEIPRP
jgi:hypothetical protein